MHVLVITSSYPLTSEQVGGVFYRSQVNALKGQGVQVGVVAPNFISIRRWKQYIKSRFKKKTHYIEEGVPVFAQEFLALLMKLPYLNYWIWGFFAKRLSAAYLKKYGRPDIIHAHTTIFAGVLGYELSRRLGVPLVITEHSSGYGRNAYKQWQLKLAKKALESADAIILVSDFLKNSIEKSLDINLDDAKIVPNVLAKHFMSLGLPVNRDPESAWFVNIGGMNANKGQAKLIDALSMLREDFKNVRLVIVGKGEEEAVLRAKVNNFGLEERVVFKGQLENEDLPKLLKECSALIVSSHYETFGVVAIEAMAAGLPVLTTPCGGVESVLVEGGGFVAGGNSAKDISEMMREYLVGGIQLQSEEIQAKARSEYSPGAVAKKLVDIYKPLIKKVLDEIR